MSEKLLTHQPVEGNIPFKMIFFSFLRQRRDRDDSNRNEVSSMSSQQGVSKPNVQVPPRHTLAGFATRSLRALYFSRHRKQLCQLRKFGVSFHPGEVTAENRSEVEFISHWPLNTVPHINDFW